MIQNQLKTAILLALLTALLLWVGSFWGTSGLAVAGLFVILMNIGTYWFSDKIVLMIYRAKEANESEYPRLHKIVNEVSHLANLPKPKVYVINSNVSNAFATGRGPKHAAVAATTGIMELLNDDELKGVIAHECSHIKNRDILIATIAGTIAGIISYVAMIARWSAIFRGFGGGRDNRDGGNVIELLILAIIAPIIATLIQLAISRSREYIADATGAKILHNGLGLASALEKLESNTRRHFFHSTGPNQATAHLFIVNPLRGRDLLSLFSTHPSVESRVKKLRAGSF